MVQQIIRDNIIIGRSEHKRSMLLVGNPGMLVNMEGKKWPHFLEPTARLISEIKDEAGMWVAAGEHRF
jgi:hypothetical protein